MKISVIGFGHIGSVIGASIASNNNTVIAIDKNINLIKSFIDGDSPISEPGLQNLVSKKIREKSLKFDNNVSSISETEIIIITVGTPLGDDNHADISHLTETCEEIEPYIRDNQLIIIKSTVPPGTTRNVVHKILTKDKKVDIVFSPERLAEGNAINELSTLPIVVGGITKNATLRASKFWRDSLGVQVIEVVSAETAELVKLANNSWIDLNIGLANDLARLSDSLDYKVDILEVIEAANSLKKGNSYVNILTPSNGVGGYCLTKDPWFVYQLGKDNGISLNTIKAGRASNDIMPEYSALKIINYFNSKKKNIEDVKISILGLSFKSNSGDIRFSPVLPFMEFLKNSGFNNIRIFDPLVTKKDFNSLKLKNCNNYQDAIKDTDCIAIMTGHNEIQNIEMQSYVNSINDDGAIFDGRIYFSQDKIKILEENNIEYLGIGR